MQRAPKKRFDEASIRTKVILLTSLSVLCGTITGLTCGITELRAMPTLFLLIVVTFGLTALACWWVCVPVERLIKRLHSLKDQSTDSALDALPTARCDEIGEVARLVEQVKRQASQERHEASQVRRKLDQRIQNAIREATEQLKQMAMRDPLTDLGNRRFLDQHLGPLVESVKDANSSLVAVMIDMDDFKKVNDQRGHAVGDDLLIMVATIVRASIRPDDYAVRLGGDEFLVLLPGCSPDRAASFANEMRSLFKVQVEMTTAAKLKPNLSIGIAWLGNDTATGDELIKKADANLYVAKRTGKGRTVVA